MNIDQSLEKMNGDSEYLINEEVYRMLPPYLLSIVNNFKKGHERDVSLFVTLTLISGVLPNYHIFYRKWHEANLFTYLFAPAGSGKGMIPILKNLLEPIHREKRKKSDKAYTEFIRAQSKRKKRNSKQAITDSNADSIDADADTDMTLPPPDEMLYIPANNTKSNIYKTFQENDSRGIICETEASTLVVALKQEYGSFNDLLLAAFHHERVSISRKTERSVEIDNPYLTILLSSTESTLRKLFPSTENGLFSRFLFLTLPPNPNFENVFDKKSLELPTTIQKKAVWLKGLYDALMKRENKVVFSLTKEQEKIFHDYFSETKRAYVEIYNSELNDVVHRQALICMRIAMILSMVRYYDLLNDEETLPDNIICDDSDFYCSLGIIEKSLENSKDAYERINSNKTIINLQECAIEEKVHIYKKCIELRNEGLSFRKIAEITMGDKSKSGTVHKIINRKF